MASNQPTLGDIRSLLLEPPSTEIWKKLWKILKKASLEELQDEYIPYIQSHIDFWPSGLRTAPSESRELFCSPQAFEKKISEKRLQRIQLIDHLDATKMGRNELSFLLQNPFTKNLHSLEFVWAHHIQGELRNALLHSDVLSNVRHLKIHIPELLDKGIFDDLKGSSWFQSVTHLTLHGPDRFFWSGPNTQQEELEASRLQSTTALPIDWWPSELKHLTLSLNRLGPFLRSLSESNVQLHTCHIEDLSDGMCTYAGTPLRSSASYGLRKLSWKGQFGLLQSSLENILSSGPYPALEQLELHGHVRAPDVFQELFAHQLFPSLRILRIENSALLTESVAGIACATESTQLEELLLQYCSVEASAIHALVHAPQWTKLKKLQLNTPMFASPESLDILCSGSSVRQLETLAIKGWKIGQKGFDRLLQEHTLQSIRTLDIRYNQIKDKQLLEIAGSPHMPALEELSFFPNTCSMHTAYIIATLPSRTSTFRRFAALNLARIARKEQLLQFIPKELHLTESTRKNQILQQLGECLEDDPRQLIKLLFSQAVLLRLNISQIKATLRDLGMKGYSKLNRKALERAWNKERIHATETCTALRDKYIKSQG